MADEAPNIGPKVRFLTEQEGHLRTKGQSQPPYIRPGSYGTVPQRPARQDEVLRVLSIFMSIRIAYTQFMGRLRPRRL